MSMREPNNWRMPRRVPSGSERVYSVNMVGKLGTRPAYQDRLALFTSSGSLPDSFVVSQHQRSYDDLIAKGHRLRFCRHRSDTDRCISEEGYPSRFDTQTALEKSNYTLALRGYSLGSDRWFQAMAAGTALIQGGPWPRVSFYSFLIQL